MTVDAVAGGQVAAEGVGLDQEDPAPGRASCAARASGRGGDPGRSLDRGEGDDGHFVPSATRDRPI